jgi:trans-aconitate methyltransferase
MMKKSREAFRTIKSYLWHKEDDFDWRTYSTKYREEMTEVAKEHTLKLSFGDYIFADGSLSRMRGVLPLHPNHRLLYETILQLHPNSAMEIGCGSGDHLCNLMTLSPYITLYGCDRSAAQIKLARRRSPDLSADLRQADITKRDSIRILPKVDLCFTQAVIMHIGSHYSLFRALIPYYRRRHLRALGNMFKLAAKHVVLMENWASHNFLTDIKSLHEMRIPPWTKANFYYRISPEYGCPHLMVVSTESLNYPTLMDYRTLLDPVLKRAQASPREEHFGSTNGAHTQN